MSTSDPGVRLKGRVEPWTCDTCTHENGVYVLLSPAHHLDHLARDSTTPSVCDPSGESCVSGVRTDGRVGAGGVAVSWGSVGQVWNLGKDLGDLQRPSRGPSLRCTQDETLR